MDRSLPGPLGRALRAPRRAPRVPAAAPGANGAQGAPASGQDDQAQRKDRQMTTTKITAPEGQPFVDIEREFDAPRDLVMRAYTEPELVKQWLGPRQYEMRIDRWDARAGGEYRYVHTDGPEQYAVHGGFHSSDMDSMIQT